MRQDCILEAFFCQPGIAECGAGGAQEAACGPPQGVQKGYDGCGKPGSGKDINVWRVSDWLGSNEGKGKLATCLTQAVGPSLVGASGEENLKNAEL